MKPGDSAFNITHAENGDDIKAQMLRADEDVVPDGSVDMQGNPVSRSRTGGWRACGFIILYELNERLAFYGITSNLINYLMRVFHQDLATSSRNVSNWVGVTCLVPLAGAYLADTYLGKYWTIAVTSVVYVLGLLSLTLSVTIKGLKPSPCSATAQAAGAAAAPCAKPNSAQVGVFFFSLYLVSIGAGGVKPCLQALGADQFDEEDPAERRRKSSFFNVYNAGVAIGTLVAFTALVYVQEKGSWAVGFGILTGAMGIALCVFLAGTPLYRHKRPGGSPLGQVAGVLVAALRKWRVSVPADSSLLLQYHSHELKEEHGAAPRRRKLVRTPGLSFLDKAAVVVDDDGTMLHEKLTSGRAARGRVWTVTEVEEVKLLVRMVPVWLTAFVYGVMLLQISTNFTKQGNAMDRRVGGSGFAVPAASLTTVTTLALLASLPAYDRLLVPAARRLTGNERGITLLQRVGVGLALSIAALAVAALVEGRRLRLALHRGLSSSPAQAVTGPFVPMGIAWLLPQYVLVGVSDAFATVGLQEFFYDQMPDGLRSLGMALYLCAIGIGSFFNSLLITTVDSVTSRGRPNRGWFSASLALAHLHIDYYYWLLTGLSTVNFIAFLFIARCYTYKKPASSSSAAGYQHSTVSAFPHDPVVLVTHNSLNLASPPPDKLYDL